MILYIFIIWKKGERGTITNLIAKSILLMQKSKGYAIIKHK